MYELHSHTFFSDGSLIPSELVLRAEMVGYKGIALTDHADGSNLESVLSKLVKAAEHLNQHCNIRVLPGVELTYIPISTVAELTQKARAIGAKVVLLHGETIVEPVIPGTNRAGIEAGVDVLAHPGLITPDDVKLAAEKGVCLEISTRRGASYTNAHVARLAKTYGAKLVMNNDVHQNKNVLPREMMLKIALGACLSEDDFEAMIANAKEIFDKACP